MWAPLSQIASCPLTFGKYPQMHSEKVRKPHDVHMDTCCHLLRYSPVSAHIQPVGAWAHAISRWHNRCGALSVKRAHDSLWLSGSDPRRGRCHG